MDPEVAKVMEDVELYRGEVGRVKRELADVVQQTLQLSGMGGMWAKLTGSYEDQVQAAEGRVATLREELAIAEAVLSDAEDRLASAREAAALRAEEAAAAEALDREASPRTEGGARGADLDARVASFLAGGPGSSVEERLAGIERLEPVVRRLRRTAEHLVDSARRTRRRQGYGVRRTRGNLIGHVVQAAQALQHDAVMDGLKATWSEVSGEALSIAAELGISLSLPQVGGGRASSQGMARGVDGVADVFPRGPMVFEGAATFEEDIEQCLPELEGMEELLREGHRSLRRELAKASRAERAPAPSASSKASAGAASARDSDLRALQADWAKLFRRAAELDRACVPGVRTSKLLGPMAAWNREAAEVAERSEALGIALRPPVNQGGDLVGFVQRLREQLPEWQREVASWG